MGAFCNTRRDFYFEKTVNMKMSFSHAAYQTSQLKRFSNLDITKKRWQKKKNTVLNSIVYFTQMKAIVFSLKQ